VAYFSQTGNTRTIAVQIHDQVGGDLFRIETLTPYPSDMASLAERKNQELKSGNMPELKAKVENIESYDVIFLGYPIWAMTTPPPVRSFIESNNLTGKTIVPFCTHDGYGPGRSAAIIKDLLPADATVLEIFDAKGSEAEKASPLIKAWLQYLKW
jgi:flavodoxin